LAAAEARILQAEARARQVGASLLPLVNFNVQAQRQGAIAGATAHEDNLGAFLNASYEADFWGKNRNLFASAGAFAQATRADRETVALTTTAGTANIYFQLLSIRERLTIAGLNLENALTVLDVIETRFRNGLANAFEGAQQRATVAALQAVIPQLQQQELDTRATLALLLGQKPEGFDVAGQSLANIDLPAVAPGLPSELLLRRPDIATAEATLESAHANVAAARAAFFPSIQLAGSLGAQNPALQGAITTLSGTGLAYAAGASLVQTVFDAGRLAGQRDEALAREQELLANYRSVVLTALSDVERSLGNIGHLTAQENFQAEQVRQSGQAFDVAQRRFAEGLDSYLTLLEAQRALYSARDQLGQTRLGHFQATVGLYRALGGGWRNDREVAHYQLAPRF
jgi:NodT family efflux transporter outer membrane factor (OMF) lipoprotein